MLVATMRRVLVDVVLRPLTNRGTMAKNRMPARTTVTSNSTKLKPCSPGLRVALALIGSTPKARRVCGAHCCRAGRLAAVLDSPVGRSSMTLECRARNSSVSARDARAVSTRGTLLRMFVARRRVIRLRPFPAGTSCPRNAPSRESVTGSRVRELRGGQIPVVVKGDMAQWPAPLGLLSIDETLPVRVVLKSRGWTKAHFVCRDGCGRRHSKCDAARSVAVRWWVAAARPCDGRCLYFTLSIAVAALTCWLPAQSVARATIR